MAYIAIPIETEPVDLAEEAFAYLEAQVPGWLPSPGNLEAWLIESQAQMASELRELAQLVPDSIFQYFGESVMALPPYAATQATATTTWTAIDAAGYSVDAGTLVGLTPPAEDTIYAFEVVDDFVVPVGATQASGVVIRAVEAGAAASGLTGTLEMLDALDFITGVELNTPTSGGTDPEPVDDYLDRLSNMLTLLAPRPILPSDFAVLVQSFFPQAARVVAIDLYNADTGATDVPRCVTIVPIGPEGQPLDAQTKADIDAFVEARREVNFLVFVTDPTYTTIDVTFDVMCYPSYLASEVQAQVIAQLQRYLSPANWGLPPFGDPGAVSWLNDTTVRYLEVAEQINRVDGVHYIVSLTLGVGGQAQSTADIPLTGVAPLPQPGTITGTVTIEGAPAE